MIIFESLLTTFEARSLFEAAGVVSKIDMSLKPNYHSQDNFVQSHDYHTEVTVSDTLLWFLQSESIFIIGKLKEQVQNTGDS